MQTSVAFDIDPTGGLLTEAELRKDNVVQIVLKDARPPWPTKVDVAIKRATPVRNGNGEVPDEVSLLGKTETTVLGPTNVKAVCIVRGTGGGEICLSKVPKEDS